MDHGCRVHLPRRIASKFTCWKRSNAVDHCCDFSKPQQAKGSLYSLRVGGSVWKPISNALIWVDVLIFLEMICKTTNARDKMVRIIKQIETLHIFLVNFLLLYIYINMSRLQNVWKQRLEERLMGPFTSGVFLQHHTWIYIVYIIKYANTHTYVVVFVLLLLTRP